LRRLPWKAWRTTKNMKMKSIENKDEGLILFDLTQDLGLPEMI